MEKGRLDAVFIGRRALDVAVVMERDGSDPREVERVVAAWLARAGSVPGLVADLAGLGIPADRIMITPGGSALNAGRVAAAWGLDVGLVGVVAEDPAGAAVQTLDRQAGLDLELTVSRTAGRTPISLIVLSGGRMVSGTERLVGRHQQVRSLFQGDHATRDVIIGEILRRAPRCLHLGSGGQRMLTLLDDLPPDTRLSLNLNRGPRPASAARLLERLIDRADLLVISYDLMGDWLKYLVPNERPAGTPVARSAQLLDALFARSSRLGLAVVTRADRGLVAGTRSGPTVELAAYRGRGTPDPVTVIDPVGAGDMFSGVLLAQLHARDWTIDGSPDGLRELLTPSAVAASLNCERLGATASIPSPTEVEMHLARAERKLSVQEVRSVRLPDTPGGSGPVPCLTSRYGRLVAGVPAAVRETLGRNDFSALTEDLGRTKTLVVVGSGSSYSLALLGAALVRRARPAPFNVVAYRPGEYLTFGRPDETVLLISQRGNPDIEAAARHAATLGIRPFLLTARPRGGLARALGTERVLQHAAESASTFVSVQGPCAAASALIAWTEQLAGRSAPASEQYRERFAQARAQVDMLDWTTLSPDTRLVALASSTLAGPLHELDLKAAEVGLELESYELKGWTHGRFQRVWRRRREHRQALIILETPGDVAVAFGIASRLARVPGRCPIESYRLQAADDALGLWQHLAHVMLLVERLAPDDPTALTVPDPLRGINRGIALASAPMLGEAPTDGTGTVLVVSPPQPASTACAPAAGQPGLVLEPPTIVPVEGSVVFLAGPITGADRSWRSEAIRLIHSLAPWVHVANPDRKYRRFEFDFGAQVDWETHFLRRAGAHGVVLFWLASEASHRCDRPFAQTSRFEFGEWMARSQLEGAKLALGIAPDFSGAPYIRRRVSQECPDLAIRRTLSATCRAAVDLLK